VYAHPSIKVRLSDSAARENTLAMQVVDSVGPTQCLFVAMTSSLLEFDFMNFAAASVPRVIDQGCS